MQIGGRIAAFCALLLFCVLLFCVLGTASAEAPSEKLSFSLHTYNDTIDTGIFAGKLGLVKKLSGKFYVDVSLGVDAITSATGYTGGGDDDLDVDVVTAATDFPSVGDGASGSASGDDQGAGKDESRTYGQASGIYDDGLNTFTAGAYYSHEDDYRGRSVFLSYARLLNSDNTELGLTLSQSFDVWKIPDIPEDERNEREIGVSVMQLLTDTWKVRLGYSMPYSEGYLASPYNTLDVDGVEVYETLPDERTGHAVSIGTVKLLDEKTSANLAYRYYADDWDIASHTITLGLFRDLSQDLTLGGRYRFYTQSEASFMKPPDEYDSGDRYAGVDYRLSDFDSHMFGLAVMYRPHMGPGALIDWDKLALKASADYYFTTDNDYVRFLYDEDSIQAVFTTWSLEYEF